MCIIIRALVISIKQMKHWQVPADIWKVHEYYLAMPDNTISRGKLYFIRSEYTISRMD